MPRARGRGAAAELRARQAQHQVGIVHVESRERLPVLLDRFLVTAVAHQLIGVTLPRGDVAGETRLVLEAAQVRERVDGALESPGGALRGAAAKEIGQDLDRRCRRERR